jgi:HTH-type transcriptional regulator, competence development regulator
LHKIPQSVLVLAQESALETKMASITARSFGQVIRERRRTLSLTQQDLAQRVEISLPYVALLETGARHPSDKVVRKLAAALALDPRELFFLANPETKALISQEQKTSEASAWDGFVKDESLRKLHNITDREMTTLSQVALMGEVRSYRDFVFILNAIRQASVQ